MTNNTRLRALLRSALPPVETAAAHPDRWALVLARQQQPRRWPWADVALAATAGLALLMRPDWLVLVAYYF